MQSGKIVRAVLGGGATEEQKEIADTDEIIVLLSDGTHSAQTGGIFPPDTEYAVKWIQKASGKIGGKEVAIEAKIETIAGLRKRLEKETDEERQQAILDQIAALEAGIQLLYQGDENEKGLYALMRQAVLLAIEREDTYELYAASTSGQEAVEQRFAQAMGDLLRDGYWSNTSYAPGQEHLLYLEASEVMAQ